MAADQASQEKLDDILYPSNAAPSFRITVIFGRRATPEYAKAVALVKRNPTYREEGEGEGIRHSAVYTPAEVEELFQLFNLVHDWNRPKSWSTTSGSPMPTSSGCR
jgi:hypothetical protein